MTSSTVFENESFFQMDKRHDIFGNPLVSFELLEPAALQSLTLYQPTIDPLFESPFQFDYRYDIYGNLIVSPRCSYL